MKYLGKCALIVHNTIANGAMKEIIRKVDAIENEAKYIKDKIGRNHEYVDVEARNAFLVNLVTPSLIKCASGYNHYGQRDVVINKQLCNAECPRCSRNESWEHVVQCKETKSLRREFVKKLLIDMLKERPEEVDRMEIFDMIEDILKYLDEEEEDFDTTQEFIGFKHLFRGIVMRD